MSTVATDSITSMVISLIETAQFLTTHKKHRGKAVGMTIEEVQTVLQSHSLTTQQEKALKNVIRDKEADNSTLTRTMDTAAYSFS